MSSATITSTRPLPTGLDMVGLLGECTGYFEAHKDAPQNDDNSMGAPSAPKRSIPSTPSLLGKRKPVLVSLSHGQIRRGVQVFLAEADLDDQGRVSNTSKAYDAKINEFREYCDSDFGTYPPETRYTIDQERVMNFMTYAAFREKKTRSKKQMFNRSEWSRIQSLFQESSGAGGMTKELFEALEPTEGVGWNVMNTTKSALRKCWRQQVEDHVNTHAEEDIFGISVQSLIKYVQQRQPRKDRNNCAKKVDKDSAPMDAIRHIDGIEESFYQSGVRSRSQATVGSSLRNRFVFLATTCGLLRGESMFKMELSDLFALNWGGPKDPHPMMILVCQIAKGKTNPHYKIFGRMTRNFDVQMCPIGALAFYLTY